MGEQFIGLIARKVVKNVAKKGLKKQGSEGNEDKVGLIKFDPSKSIVKDHKETAVELEGAKASIHKNENDVYLFAGIALLIVVSIFVIKK